MSKIMYRAFDKKNKVQIEFSHESDAINALNDGWIDGYEPFEKIEPLQ